MRRVLMIVNPVAGRTNPTRLVRRVERRLTESDVGVEVLETVGVGDATRIAADVADRTETVVVFGGDGTCREVARGLNGKRIPLVPVPTGTESIFARELGMKARAKRVVRAVISGQRRMCDVGWVNGEHMFLVVAGVGFDAEVLARVVRRRVGHQSNLDYIGPLLRTFFAYRFPVIRVFDGSLKKFDGRGIVLVGNMARYALGLRVVRDAKWDDGLLDVVVFPCSTRTGLVRHAVWTVARRHFGRNGVVCFRSRRVVVEHDDAVGVQVDGEIVNAGRYEFTVDRGGLWVQV